MHRSQDGSFRPWGYVVKSKYLRASLGLYNSSINERGGCPNRSISPVFSF